MKANKQLHGGFGARVAQAAALGLLLSACEDKPEVEAETTASTAGSVKAAAKGSDADCCMGKNPCKGKGGCAVPESHECMGKNPCKGKGGCEMHCPK